jgi:hypothetical protein
MQKGKWTPAGRAKSDPMIDRKVGSHASATVNAVKRMTALKAPPPRDIPVSKVDRQLEWWRRTYTAVYVYERVRQRARLRTLRAGLLDWCIWLAAVALGIAMGVGMLLIVRLYIHEKGGWG